MGKWGDTGSGCMHRNCGCDLGRDICSVALSLFACSLFSFYTWVALIQTAVRFVEGRYEVREAVTFVTFV